MYYLLSKQRFNPTQPAAVLAAPSLAELKQWLPMSSAQRLWAIDLETKGVDASDPNSEIVGIGLCDGTRSIYIGLPNISMDSLSYIRSFIVAIPRLTAFNVMFDAAFLYKFCGKEEGRWLAWEGCSYGLFKQLSGEGHKGQRWNLETAQLEVLGWPTTNKAALDTALKERGLGKGDMWQLPVEILGPYCAMDAEAAFQLWDYLTSVCKDRKFDELMAFHKQEFMTMCKLLIVQQHRGIQVDRQQLEQYHSKLDTDITLAMDSFLTHESVAPVVAAFNESVASQYAAKEPAKLTKTGKESARWIAWSQNGAAFFEKNQFNSNSKKQLAWLFYEKMGCRVLKKTPTGLPVVDKSVLPSLGEPGKLLVKYNKLTKERSYVAACLNILRGDTAHPQFRWPGTLTGRPAGSGRFNWLQQPKTRGYLECIKARPGHKLVQLDFCLHPDTEYLTKRGWMKIEDVVETDLVWQVDPSTKIGSWTTPLRIVRREYSGQMYAIGNRRGVLHVTENHRMLWINQQERGRPYKFIISQSQEGVPNAYISTILNTSISEAGGYRPSEKELNMVCMLQADASVYGPSYQIQVSLTRKREEVASLLGRRGTVRPPRGGQTLETETWSGIRFTSPLLRGKKFSFDELSSDQADSLVKYLGMWDGSIGKARETMYYTTDKDNVEQVQRFLVRSGYECKIASSVPTSTPKAQRIYRATIRKSRGLRLRKGIDDTKKYHFSGTVGCLTVDTGCILVRSGGQTFVTGNCALEPTILAEFSQDPALLKIYGEGVPENDIYLFTACHMGSLGDKIRTYYDPENPTPESIEAAKKHCKAERNIAKTLTLAANYGAFPKKIHETLTLGGVDISLNAVMKLHRDYWRLYAGVTRFKEALEDMWEANGGWIVNGMGRPICVSFQMKKDILNRFAQATASDYLAMFVHEIYTRTEAREIPLYPFLANFYDETIGEVEEQYAEQVADIYREALKATNERLKMGIMLKGSVLIANTLADIKVG